MAKGYLEVTASCSKLQQKLANIPCDRWLPTGIQVWLLHSHPNFHDSSVCHQPRQARGNHQKREYRRGSL